MKKQLIGLFQWSITIALLGTGLLATSIAIAKMVAVQQEKKIEQEAKAFVSQFPPTDFNETANKIRKLTPKLGFKLISLPSKAKTEFSDEQLNIEVAESDRQAWEAISNPLRQYLDDQFSTEDDAISPPPQELQDYLSKNAATIQAIRDIVLTQPTPVYWSDITPMLEGDSFQLSSYISIAGFSYFAGNSVKFQLSSYIGLANLQQILALDILEKQRQGKTQAAIYLLEVSWKITENLQESPFWIAQVFNLITKRYISGTIRKLDRLPEVWPQRLAKQDYLQLKLVSIKADIFSNFYKFINDLNRSGIMGIYEELGAELPVGLLTFIQLEPFNHAYFRLAAIDFYQSDMRYLEKLEKRDRNICQSDGVDIEPDIAAWTKLFLYNRTIAEPSFFYQLMEGDKYMLNLELTQNILQVKELAVKNGKWPEKMDDLESEICPGFTWVYQVAEDGTMSLSLNPKPGSRAERLEGYNELLPLIYRDRTITGNTSQ